MLTACTCTALHACLLNNVLCSTIFPLSSDPGKGNTSEVDVTTPQDATTPVPKPRTHLLANLSNESVARTTSSDAFHSDAHLHRSGSASSTGRDGVGSGSPPAPRPRPRSVEHKKWEQEKQQLQERIEELSEIQSHASHLEKQLNHANAKIGDLEARNSELESQCSVDVEESLREKDVALQLARNHSLELQMIVKAKDMAVQEKESLLKKKDSQISGLEGQVECLKDPMKGDIKKRTEVRLSEAIGRSRQMESDLLFIKEVSSVKYHMRQVSGVRV